MTENCPCRKKDCPRHGDCAACRKYHAGTSRQRPVRCERHLAVRPFKPGDEQAVSDLICRTIAVSNSRDYPPEYIRDSIGRHTPDVIAEQAKDMHFYVATDHRKIVGCGGITGYWGSTTESYLLSVFVLPEYQGRGIGKRIVETLEADEYFLRAWRTEIGSSLTAVGFYKKLGYEFKNGVTEPDEYHVVRMEKIRK